MTAASLGTHSEKGRGRNAPIFSPPALHGLGRASHQQIRLEARRSRSTSKGSEQSGRKPENRSHCHIRQMGVGQPLGEFAR